MNTPRHPSSPSDENPDDTVSASADIFEGLVPLDVIDGELVPRRRRRP